MQAPPATHTYTHRHFSIVHKPPGHTNTQPCPPSAQELMPQDVELGFARGRCMRAGLILAAIEADATRQGCLKSGHRLQSLQRPPLLLQGPAGPWRWKEGDWARVFWCWALVSSPYAHWGCTGGPELPFPEAEILTPAWCLTEGPPLTHLPRTPGAPSYPGARNPETAEGVSLRACPGASPPQKPEAVPPSPLTPTLSTLRLHPCLRSWVGLYTSNTVTQVNLSGLLKSLISFC